MELTLRIILKKELELREPAQTEREFNTEVQKLCCFLTGLFKVSQQRN